MDISNQAFDLASFKTDNAATGVAEMIVSVFHNIDAGREIVMPGAFKDSLERRRNKNGLPRVKGLWSHNWMEIPVAKTLEAEELTAGDPRLPDSIASLGGLYIKGHFNLEVPLARDVFSSLTFGSLDEFSIGYSVIEDSWDRDTNVHRLLKLDLWEWSPVVVGMNDSTELISAKDAAAAGEKPYPNEHACRLRDPGDFQDGSFRRTSRTSDGKKYDVILGKLKNEDTMTEQAYRYPKSVWTAAQARKHCDEHDGILFEPASKLADCECHKGDKGVAYEVQIDQALAAVVSLTDRTKSLADLRAKEGRAINSARREQLINISTQLRNAATNLDDIVKETEPPKSGVVDYSLLLDMTRLQLEGVQRRLA